MMRFFAGNRLTLLHNGVEYFPELEKGIEHAESEIFLEAYIFENDNTGRRIAEALKHTAQRGVTVHLLLDGFGSKSLPLEMMDDMLRAGVQVLLFRPEVLSFKFRRQRLRRMHRKIAVIDCRIAFVGGINIIDDMHTPKQVPPRFDYAVKVEGMLLRAIHAAVRDLWTRVTWTHLRHEWRHTKGMPPAVRPCGDQRAALVTRDNLRHRRDIEQAYLNAIAGAKQEIIIANAYFLPGRAFRRALVKAASRGVRVILLLQGRVEYALLHYASRALYGYFLNAGVEIYEYHKSFLHAKVAAIDGYWATVGSSNIDPFSMLLAKEANVVVEDSDFARQLVQSLMQAVTRGAKQVMREQWKKLPLAQRFLIWISYGMARLFTGMFGYGRE
jgi:cardiolipin synthase